MKKEEQSPGKPVSHAHRGEGAFSEWGHLCSKAETLARSLGPSELQGRKPSD